MMPPRLQTYATLKPGMPRRRELLGGALGVNFSQDPADMRPPSPASPVAPQFHTRGRRSCPASPPKGAGHTPEDHSALFTIGMIAAGFALGTFWIQIAKFALDLIR